MLRVVVPDSRVVVMARAEARCSVPQEHAQAWRLAEIQEIRAVRATCATAEMFVLRAFVALVGPTDSPVVRVSCALAERCVSRETVESRRVET